MALLSDIATAILGGNAQESAIKEAAGVQRRNFKDTVALSSPRIQAGNNALLQFLQLLGVPLPEIGDVTIGKGRGAVTVPGSSLEGGGGNPLEMLAQTPGFQFRLGEGEKAFDRSAVARGGLLSGAAIKGRERFAQNFASNEFDRALNRLMPLLGMGERSTGGVINAGTGTANNLSNLALQRGAVRASTFGGINDAFTTAENRLLGFAGGF